MAGQETRRRNGTRYQRKETCKEENELTGWKKNRKWYTMVYSFSKMGTSIVAQVYNINVNTSSSVWTQNMVDTGKTHFWMNAEVNLHWEYTWSLLVCIRLCRLFTVISFSVVACLLWVCASVHVQSIPLQQSLVRYVSVCKQNNVVSGEWMTEWKRGFSVCRQLCVGCLMCCRLYMYSFCSVCMCICLLLEVIMSTMVMIISIQ